MKFALDSETCLPISPVTHHLRKKLHGRNAICGACKTEVFDHSVGSLKVMPHFSHLADSGPCPLKSISPEGDDADKSGDGKRLREEFLKPESIQFAYALCQELVCGALKGDRRVEGNFTTGRLIELIKTADLKRTWFLKGLTVKTLPFCLVANEVFNIRFHKNDRKPKAFTFILDKTAIPKEDRKEGWSIPVDTSKSVYLRKHFVREDGTPGSFVKELAPGNPFAVSDESATKLAGENWQRLPLHRASAILAELG